LGIENRREVMAAKVKDLAVFRKGSRIWIKSPYDPGFVHYLKSLGGGKWEPVEKMWHFDASREAELVSLVKSYFGVELEVGKTVAVKVDGVPKGGDKQRERAFMFARDLATLMPVLTEEEKEKVYELLFMQKEEEELREIEHLDLDL
jgi:hypothetical protein